MASEFPTPFPRENSTGLTRPDFHATARSQLLHRPYSPPHPAAEDLRHEVATLARVTKGTYARDFLILDLDEATHYAFREICNLGCCYLYEKLKGHSLRAKYRQITLQEIAVLAKTGDVIMLYQQDSILEKDNILDQPGWRNGRRRRLKPARRKA